MGDSGSSGAEEVTGEQVIGVYTEEAPRVLAGGSGVWASERAMETDPPGFRVSGEAADCQARVGRWEC